MQDHLILIIIINIVCYKLVFIVCYKFAINIVCYKLVFRYNITSGELNDGGFDSNINADMNAESNGE